MVFSRKFYHNIRDKYEIFTIYVIILVNFLMTTIAIYLLFPAVYHLQAAIVTIALNINKYN